MLMFSFISYSTKYGIYKPNCGLDNVTMSWGHDGTVFFISIHSSSFNKEHDLNRPCVKVYTENHCHLWYHNNIIIIMIIIRVRHLR